MDMNENEKNVMVFEVEEKERQEEKEKINEIPLDKSPEISLIQMRNSNEITNSNHFGEMRVSSEIRKKTDDMFFSKDESFFREINSKNMQVFDKMFEKKKEESPSEGFKKKTSPETLEKVENIVILEAKENEHGETDDEEPQREDPLRFSDFNIFEKKKNVEEVEQSTAIVNLESRQEEEVKSEEEGNFEQVVLDSEVVKEEEHLKANSGNFTKRKSGFYPNHPKTLNEASPMEVELTQPMSNFSVDKHKREGQVKEEVNVASITSLGATSYLKKDFTKDKVLVNKGYSQNLLRAMNQYSMVLDHIKSVQKNQVDPYKDVKSIFELKNVHKTYLVGMEGVPAIRGIDLKIYEGEFLMIYGKSGGGKSSLLNLIGTIDEPNKGSIQMDGQGFLDCLKDPQLSHIRMNNIGFVFQSFNLINSLTALENIKLPMLLQGKMNAKEVHERAVSLMEELSILHRKDSYPKQMSGGEQQRVTIARAVSNKPKMLLLDEPTGDLDSKNSLIVMRILLELNIKEKITMIMVTHDEHIKDLANRIVYMIDGKISKCVVNPKNQRKKIINKLLSEAEEVRKEMKELKLRDAQNKNEQVPPKKVFRNPIHHPFFKHLARKATGYS